MFRFSLLKIYTFIKKLVKKIYMPWLLVTVFIIGIAITTTINWSANYTKPADTIGAIYRDPKQPTAVRVNDLLSRMTTAEKIGQLALVEKNSIHDPDDLIKYGIGALLSGGGAKPNPNTPLAWLEMVNGFQIYSQHTRLGIPLLYGADGMHGNANVPGATIFPHFIGLGAANEVDLVRRVGQATAEEMAATGINWDFSPNLDVVKDTRWGRTYESFGSNSATVSNLGRAYIEGVNSFSENLIVSTAKHYVGAGAMNWGSSSNKDFKIDQGTTEIDETTLRRVHLPPFKAAIEARVMSVMAGLNSWDGVKVSANGFLLTDVLKKELDFRGFVVSDWYGVYEIPGGEYQAIVTAIKAGVDMVMLPYDHQSFVSYVTLALRRGDITEARLNEAVGRILTVKFKAGLFDRPLVNNKNLSQVGNEEHRELAREAVRKSLVLLKNKQHTLPLNKQTNRIIVAGSSAHNIGRQCGGWTVEWQGIDGNWIPGTTILDGIKKIVAKDAIVDYDLQGNFTATDKLAEVGIAIVGEAPYAEGWGDLEHPTLTSEDLQTIAKVKAASQKLVVVIVSGRPLDIQPYINKWDAVVAAWLPGSEGGGVADVLFGDYPFTGTLPVSWSY